MRQTGTQPTSSANTKAKRPDMTFRQALIVLGVTTAVSIAIGLLPHFG